MVTGDKAREALVSLNLAGCPCLMSLTGGLDGCEMPPWVIRHCPLSCCRRWLCISPPDGYLQLDFASQS